MNTIAKVLEFHEAFGCAIGPNPGLPREVSERATLKRVFGGDMLDKALFRFREGAALGDAKCSRLALITEELLELCDAGAGEDALDALVDLRYVLDGTVIAFGFHRKHEYAGEDWERPTPTIFDVAFNRVHAANMAKLHDGKAVHDSTGKVVKPAGWVAADLSDLVV